MPASQQPLPIHLHIQPYQTAPTVPLPYAPNSISSTTIIIDSAPAADPSILPVAHTDPVTSVIVPDPVHNDKPAIVSASSSSQSKKSQSTTPRVPARPEPAPTDTELERLRKVNRARRNQLNEDITHSQKAAPLLISTPLASSAELLAYSTVLLQRPHSAHFVDWSTHVDNSDSYYFSFEDNA